MSLTLGEVLDVPAFGLDLRSGTAAARTRGVAGAEVVEVDRPVELSARKHLLLTTGVRLRGNPGLQRKLVVEAEAQGVTAIGFGTGLVFRSVPRAVLDEAARRSFPVFEVPLEVPFRDIIGFVNRSVMSEEYSSFHRAVSLQDSLLGALDRDHPEVALVERLAAIVGAASLHRPTGEVVAAAGDAPFDRFFAALPRTGHAPGYGVDGWHVAPLSVDVDGERRCWLLVAGGPDAAPMIRPLLNVAGRLVHLVEMARDVGAMEARVRRSEVVAELLDPQRAGEVSGERLALHGLAAGPPFRVGLVALGAGVDAVLAQRALESAIAVAGDGAIVATHGSGLAIVSAGDDPPAVTWAASVADAGIDAWIALGRAVPHAGDLPASRGDAQLGLDALGRSGAPAGSVVGFDDLALADALLAAVPAEPLRARVDALLQPLQEHPQLLESLRTFIDCDGNVIEAARTLHVHPNSVRYRLGRVEALLGRSLRDLGVVVDLWLALRAEARFDG